MARFYKKWERELIWDNCDGGRWLAECGICGRKARKSNWEADHIDPWIDSQDSSIENGQVAHPWCNREKNDGGSRKRRNGK